MSESCEIYVKPHVACNLIDVALEGHSGMLPASGPEHILYIYGAMARTFLVVTSSLLGLLLGSAYHKPLRLTCIVLGH